MDKRIEYINDSDTSSISALFDNSLLFKYKTENNTKKNIKSMKKRNVFDIDDFINSPISTFVTKSRDIFPPELASLFNQNNDALVFLVDNPSFESVITNCALAVNYLYDQMRQMAVVMTNNPDIFSDPGTLFLVQTQLQIMKDAIAAITAVGKTVADTLSATVQNFASNVGRL